jgi:hypothetical protein
MKSLHKILLINKFSNNTKIAPQFLKCLGFDFIEISMTKLFNIE